MVRARVIATAVALLLIAGAVLAPAGPAAAAACGSATPSAVTGGYQVKLYCEGDFIVGYGSNLNDANQQALLLYQLRVNLGVNCSGTEIAVVSGGYRVQLWCAGDFVNGYGSNLTAASIEARELATLPATVGVRCNGTEVALVSGGYRMQLWCAGDFVNGYGSTLTAASAEARELAILRPTRGLYCSGSSVALVSGGYRVQLWCAGDYVSGLGSTLTAAAQNARLAASLG